MKDYSVKVDSVTGLSRFSNGFIIRWSGDIGFGEYTILIDENGKLIGYSECMDQGDDKSFLEGLFRDILKQIEIQK